MISSGSWPPMRGRPVRLPRRISAPWRRSCASWMSAPMPSRGARRPRHRARRACLLRAIQFADVSRRAQGRDLEGRKLLAPLIDASPSLARSMIKLQRSVVQLTEASSVFQNPAAPGSATAPTMKDMQAAVSALATTRKLAAGACRGRSWPAGVPAVAWNRDVVRLHPASVSADAAASSRTVTGLGAAFSSVLIAVEKAEHSVRARAAAHMQRHLRCAARARWALGARSAPAADTDAQPATLASSAAAPSGGPRICPPRRPRRARPSGP